MTSHHLGRTLILISLFAWILSPQETAGKTTNQLYLPLIFLSDQVCGVENLVNGNFEQDDVGWSLFSTGVGWKEHDLIGSEEEGFSPYEGNYAARLGGYEGVWDYIEQPVLIPPQGSLSFWWKMGSYETLPHTDWFSVYLFETDYTWIKSIAFHDDQDLEGVWQEDVIDLTEFEGQTLIVRFISYNDNYYFTWFDLDEIHLCSVYQEDSRRGLD
jgi:hypothetical protein